MRSAWLPVLAGMVLTSMALGLARETDAATLARYVSTPPGQVRGLRVSGSEFQETHLTLRFSTAAPVRFPLGENLRAETAAQAREFARNSPCAAEVSRQSSVRLWRARAATNIGRLVVNTGQQFCVFVWNTDS